MDPLSSVASVIAVVQISERILTLCCEYAVAVKDAKGDIDRLNSEVTALYDVLKRVKYMAEGPDATILTALNALAKPIAQCSSELLALRARLDPTRQTMNRLGLRSLKWPFKSKDVNKIIEVLQRYKTTVNMALNADQCQLIIGVGGDVKQLAQDCANARENSEADLEGQLLAKLPSVDGAAFNSRLWEHEPLCLPETRVDLLQQIMTWSEDPNGACIFWLNGIAGTGKSTISRTIARACANQKRLGASFFFSRGRGDLGHATKFFTSLAVQLANTVSALKPYVCRALAENLNISQHGLAEQWEHLIFQPLSNLKGVRSQSFILVIDALDECEGEDDTRLILRLLAEVNTLNTVRLQVFMTSRPETLIRFGFHAIPDTAHQDFVLHNISPSIIQHDISIFLHHKLENIRRENGFSEGWPGESRNGLLCQRASGLFIYASTACRFIRDPLWDPDESLSLILQDDYVGQSPTRELDEMYTKILTHSIILGDRHKRDSEKLSGEFKQLIGAIVILFDALPASMLARLLEMPIGTVGVRLRCLHSVMDVPDNPKSPIRLLHPSFRNFLVDHQRCLDPQFWIDEKMAHMDLLMSCLKLMSKHLRRDMCNLRLPGAVASNVENSVVEKCIPLDVQYACRYWVYHLQRGSIKLDNNELENKELDTKELRDNGQVHIFLKHHFLHWLEALSLIGRISEGVLAVKCLESMTSKFEAKHDLPQFVYDAKRFVVNNRWIIEYAPLQLYCSALVFSPRMSRIKCQFADQAPVWIKRTAEVLQDWNPSLQSLKDHSAPVAAIVFSPDGKLLASGLYNRAVRFWDLSTGASRDALEAHSNRVTAVIFSPDGQFLASASKECTVRLWNTSTGTSHCILEGHSEGVTAVEFSPDSLLLASASKDCTVRLWDPSTGSSRAALQGHSEWVSAVSFSPDGLLLASASHDSTVRLWDPSSGTSRATLEGHLGMVFAIEFSPNGQLLASASKDNTVRLWNPSIGALNCTLQGHLKRVSVVIFSPDGLLLASASNDNTVRIWDPSTGALRASLEGHSHWVTALAFSPDGHLLASASRDGTVRLWDSSTGASHSTLQGHSQWVTAVAFSPDGNLLASASLDSIVRLWDPSVEALCSTLEGHSHCVFKVDFSPDGQLLASASADSTVRLWDPLTGASRGTLEGHSETVNLLVFSPDGQLLASASMDNTVRLWDPLTGASRGALEGHSEWVTEVIFSPDGQLLASASEDCTVRLWDPSTGVSRCTLEGHSNWVYTLAFSPDGRLLASASRDSTVRLWDPSTGASSAILQGHSDCVIAVTFSPDSLLLASASRDNTVRLWNSSTGALHGALEGHLWWVSAVAFSPDGQVLASASFDNTVRLWDVKTKETIQNIPTGDGIRTMSFSRNGAYLDTCRGIVELDPLTACENRPQSAQLICSLYITWDWVTMKTENVLWLPPDYRAMCVAVRHNLLVIGHPSGGVSFIELDPSTIPFASVPSKT